MFMNHVKLQMDILKAVEAAEFKHKMFNWHWKLTDEALFVTDGYGAWRIPKTWNYLNVETAFRNMPPSNIDELFKEPDELFPVIQTNRKVALPNGKKNQLAVVFTIDKAGESEIWVDEALLKYYDLSECSFKAKDSKSLIFVYAYGTLIGLVLPVRH